MLKNKTLILCKPFLLAFFLIFSLIASPSLANGKHDFIFEVSSGDAFYKFFYKTGLSAKLLTKLMASDKSAQKLNKIYPGDKFRIILNDKHGLEQIIFSPVNSNPLYISYENNKFRFNNENNQSKGRLSHTTIIIDKSLNYDAKKAGIDAEIVKLMVDNFSWEIDFSRDLRKGDKFILSWDGEKKPHAMIYVNDKKIIALFGYKNNLGQKIYYTAEGYTLNDSFTFAPVKYSRISSGFTLRRLHPTLKVYRPHRGTDFVAPSGTPIYAPAKGVIKYTKTLNGYGNVIYLKHGSELLTVYAHLSNFAKGLKPGKRISKGALIGYVGSTGASTGPHLHYEIRINGVHQDAEKVKLPSKLLVPKSEMARFQSQAKDTLISLGIKPRF